MFGSIGPVELILIFIIILIVFGADRLPELARGMGKGIREFKRAAEEVKSELMVDDLKIDLNKPVSEATDRTKEILQQGTGKDKAVGGPVSAKENKQANENDKKDHQEEKKDNDHPGNQKSEKKDNPGSVDDKPPLAG